MSIRYVVCILRVCLALILGLPSISGKAQQGIAPTKQSIDKTLSLRVIPRHITYERPIAGSPLKINNGATVLIQSGTIQGVISPIGRSIKLVPNIPIAGRIEGQQRLPAPIEMRILGQNVYLDRLVELLIVQDITGRSIKTLINGNKMPLDDLRPGVYVIRVQDKGLTHTSKFILR